MKRIILHWTAGGHQANALDRRHYHVLIEAGGNVVFGEHAIEANAAPIRGAYAAHTLNCNTDSIGVALCGMRGAVERPFSAGPSPITEAQLRAMAVKVSRLCTVYGIPVTRETVLTHAEVQPTLGIRQKAKWDITWLPGMDRPGDPVAVGDVLRDRIREALPVRRPPPVPPDVEPVPPRPDGGWFLRWLASLLRR